MIALLTLITFNYHILPWGEDHSVSNPCFSTPSQRLNVLGVSKYQWYHGDAEMCFKIEWWSLVVSAGPWYLTWFALFCQFSQQNMDEHGWPNGPTKIPSRLAMACRWRSPLI